ncbi:MAG: hypothetical protein Q8L95_06160 [Burkholderiales bacterium]|nr:hypothetical protein [Burkholderiales bacterium]
MTPGSVVFFKDFTFHDGDHADKFLIVLNDGNKRPYLVLKTTSRQKSRPNKEGCHSSKGCYFLPAKRDWFRMDTWILLYEPYEIDAAAFLKAKFSGDAEIKASLKPDLVRAIINCFARADDCSEHHLSLLK